MIMRSISEAKAQLSSLVQAVLDGEEVILDRSGVPVARIIPFEDSHKTREAGGLKVIHMSDDFDAEDPAINRMFYGASE
jgi:prevent-host-death family protein